MKAFIIIYDDLGKPSVTTGSGICAFIMDWGSVGANCFPTYFNTPCRSCFTKKTRVRTEIPTKKKDIYWYICLKPNEVYKPKTKIKLLRLTNEKTKILSDFEITFKLNQKLFSQSYSYPLDHLKHIIEIYWILF